MADKQQAATPFEVYERLAAPFDSTFKDVRGGVELEYATGEQVISRLNEVLGLGGWAFSIREHGINAEADECWVLGELTVNLPAVLALPERTLRFSQFGSQKVKRSRSSGTPLDIGFDLKGAGTDSLKKCATLIGVGLYLSKKEAQQQSAAKGREDGPPKAAPDAPDGTALICEECDEVLTATSFKDGNTWTPAQLAGYGRRKHSRVLCMTHYREANQAKRRAEEALQQVPF